MTAHTLVQGVLAARRDLRLKHELAVLDVSDAVTILVTPPLHPERSTDGLWLGPDDNYLDDNYLDDNYPDDNYPDDNYPDDNYPDDNYPDDNYPGALSPITTSPATSSTTTTTPKPGRSTDGTWPDNPPATAHPLTKEDPTTKLRKTKNRIQRTEV
jgi:hypothetical protein